MSPLTPIQLSSVLQLLHPLELDKLPDSLKPTAFAAFSDSACPMDLTPPLYHIDVDNSTPFASDLTFTTTPRAWAADCESLLESLSARNTVCPPVASLLLTRPSRSAEASLSRLFTAPNPPTSLQMFVLFWDLPLSFLPAATSLTRLHLGTSSIPRTSLLEALTSLSNLQDLSLCLNELSVADTQLLHSLSGQSEDPQVSSAASPLIRALKNVRRVRLIRNLWSTQQWAEYHWPELLCHALPLTSLEELTLSASQPGIPDLLDGSSRKSPHRLTSLKLRNKIRACGFVPCGSSSDIRDIRNLRPIIELCHAVAHLQTLRVLELDCRGDCIGHLSPLSRLSALEVLQLDNVRMGRDEELSFLTALVGLCSLELRFFLRSTSKTWRHCCQVAAQQCRQVAAALPLTRLCLRGCENMDRESMDRESMATVAAMRALRDLELGWPKRARVDAAEQSGFQSMIQGLTGLTALCVPALVDAESMGGVLQGLQSLRKLELHVPPSLEHPGGQNRRGPAGNSWSEEMGGRGGALESVQIHAERCSTAMWYIQHLRLALGRVTSLKVSTSGAGVNEEVDALGSCLACMPELETLHLPGEKWEVEPFAVLAVHIGRLKRLEELALWNCRLLQDAAGADLLLNQIRGLPLRRGIH